MATIRVPYLQWRDGRPRWVPGPGLRSLGHKGRDLKDDAGQWLGLEAAIAVAKEINTGAAQPRLPRPPRIRTQPTRTCQALFEAWEASPAFKTKAETTRRDYRNKAQAFLRSGFADAPVAILNQAQLYGFWQEMYEERGHAMANGIIAVVRTMLEHALPKRLDWRRDNPAKALGLEGLAPRVVIWSPSETAHLIDTADALGLHSIADACFIALHTGQRQGDVLAFEMPRAEGGKAWFRQSKTKAIVSVPFTPPLQARIDAIVARRSERSGPVVALATARHAIIMEATGEAYVADTFRHKFADVRAAAARTMPSIAAKWFLDLRDTAITRLALAGCTIPEIRAITGHSLETIHSVLKHYLALDDAMAKAGIDKLTHWMEREGIAV